MPYRIEFTKSVGKQIVFLEKVIQKRLSKKMLELSESENIVTKAKMLSGSLAGMYRVRIGDYRIVFEVKGDVITIIAVRHRKDVYR